MIYSCCTHILILHSTHMLITRSLLGIAVFVSEKYKVLYKGMIELPFMVERSETGVPLGARMPLYSTSYLFRNKHGTAKKRYEVYRATKVSKPAIKSAVSQTWCLERWRARLSFSRHSRYLYSRSEYFLVFEHEPSNFFNSQNLTFPSITIKI